MNIFINFCIAAFGLWLFCYLKAKENREAKKILAKWLENEKIVQLLEKSQVIDFICQPRKDTNIFRLKMDYDHSKLLREYVNDDKVFYKYAILILSEYYYNQSNNQIEESYIHFKNKIELN